MSGDASRADGGALGVDRYRGPEYRRLLVAARKSMERTGGDLAGRISVAEPDDAERKAIIGITGIHQPAGTKRLTVPLADLDAAVRRATGLGLAALLAALRGPFRARAAETASPPAAAPPPPRPHHGPLPAPRLSRLPRPVR